MPSSGAWNASARPPFVWGRKQTNWRQASRGAISVAWATDCVTLTTALTSISCGTPSDPGWWLTFTVHTRPVRAKYFGRERQKVESRPVPAANATESVLGDRELLRSPGWINNVHQSWTLSNWLS